MNVYDVIGVGIGPFNLSLAALLEAKPIKSIFFDQKGKFDWHPGLMMDWTTLQVPFLADLVTMADPTNRFSFLNYLKEKGRLYPFFFKEDFLILRKEYNDYCRWVSERLSSCHFGYQVLSIDYKAPYWEVIKEGCNGKKERVLAKNIVLGVGSSPSLPHALTLINDHMKTKVHHSSSYLNIKDQALNSEHISIIGSGQSAAEVFIDLMQSKKRATKISWLTRSKGFFPMEYSKLGLEHFSSDYIDYFYHLDEKVKTRLIKEQDLLYKGISAKSIADIYDLLYQEKAFGKKTAELIANSQLYQLSYDEKTKKIQSSYLHQEQNKRFCIPTDFIIAATGYQSAALSVMDNIKSYFAMDENGQFQITRDYALKPKSRKLQANIFVQNAEMHTHGVGAPDLTLGAYRSGMIANQLMGENIYQFPGKSALTAFGVPDNYLLDEDKNDYVNNVHKSADIVLEEA